MITVDAEQSIGEQHRQIRQLFLEGQRAAVVGLERGCGGRMAGHHRPRNRSMTTTKAPTPELIAVDGIDPAAMLAEARMALGRARRGGISHWDASGIFQDLAVADEEAGAPSPRTLSAALCGRPRVPPALADPAGARRRADGGRGALRRHGGGVRARGGVAAGLAGESVPLRAARRSSAVSPTRATAPDVGQGRLRRLQLRCSMIRRRGGEPAARSWKTPRPQLLRARSIKRLPRTPRLARSAATCARTDVAAASAPSSSES